jgi:hypothetical protein
MAANQRKSTRTALTSVAFLYSSDGWPLGECKLKDISKTGAQLIHEIKDELPDEFLLSMSRDGRVKRSCKVAWRKDDRLGVTFC